MKKLVTFIIVSFLFSGCWVVVDPYPVSTVTVSTPEVVVTSCTYDEPYGPYSDAPTYCEGDCCVWQDLYSTMWCEEVWCRAYNYCGYELVENGCYHYY